MSKFILIDPSVQDFQGHYCEYAMRVLRAAEGQGYTPVLGANRRFRASQAVDAQVCPVYRYAFWFSSTRGSLLRRLTDFAGAVKRFSTRLKARLVFSNLGLVWTLYRRLPECLQRKTLTSRSALPLLLLLAGAYLGRVGKAAVRLLLGVIPLRGYLGRRWADLRHLAGSGLSPLRHLFGASGAIRHSIWIRVKMRQFARDTRRLFRKVPLQEGDAVFLAVTSVVEVVALSEYFRGDPQSPQATWHLLFRHQLYTAEEGAPRDDTSRPLRNAFRSFRESLAGHRVYFYADTDDLVDHYNRLGVFEFHPLPVPISPQYHAQRRVGTSAAPLRISYVGDARREKGYQYLPRVVADLRAEYLATGQAEFLIQSNFSIPAGVPETVVARAQLEAMLRDHVTLITQPLDPNEYRALVLGAHIILLPYDRTAYYAGSSGILAEALAAGVPVVVPAGTWMAAQLRPPICRYHQSLRKRIPILKTYCGADVRWRLEAGAWSHGFSDGRLHLGGRRRQTCKLPIPPGATDLLITFRPQASHRGHYVEVTARQTHQGDEGGREQTQIIDARDTPVSALIKLQPQAGAVRLGFRDAYSDALLEIFDISFDFLQSEKDLPVSSVGMILSDCEELSGAVREIIDHYPHYSESAQYSSSGWVEYHNQDNLVRVLLSRATRRDPAHTEVPPVPGFLRAPHRTLSPKEQGCQHPR